MVEVHRGCNFRQCLHFLPCSLHFRGVVNIVKGNNAFFIQERDKVHHIPFGRFIGMVGVYKNKIPIGNSILPPC